MKKIFGVAFFVISLMFTLFQNLVVNSSFENLVGILQCDCYTTQAEFDNAITGWTCPTGGSTHISDVEQQLPRTCDVRNNVTVYGDGGCTPCREYLQGYLTSYLVSGVSYFEDFYVSFDDNCSVATNNIGVYFITSAVDDLSMCVYDVTPQLNNDIILNHFTI